MTILAHTLSASVLSLMIAKVDPSQINYLLVALLTPAILDLDHLFLLVSKRKAFKAEGFVGHLHKARSFMHEMLGVLIMGIISLVVFKVDTKMATVIFFSYLIHMIEDLIMGISMPFSPVSRMECSLFKLTFKQKAFADICLIIISILLWVNYLKG